MKKLYLHMGLHKTGSTSFQETCKINKEKLLAQNFIYPLFNSNCIPIKDIANHSIPLYSLFCEDATKYHVNVKYKVENIELLHKEYINTLENTLKSDKNIIISGEDISLLGVEGLQKLKAFIEKYDFEIIPIIIVRPPHSFLCSIKQENIRHGNVSKKDFFSSKIDTIESIKEVFPKTSFVSFKIASKVPKGVCAYLFNQMQVDYSCISYAQTNVSMSNTLARILDIINKKIGRYKENTLNPNYFELVAFLQSQITKNKNKYLLTEEEYLLIKDKCDKENTYYKDTLGDDFCDNEIIFSKKDMRLDIFYKNIEENCKNMSDKEIILHYKKAIKKYFTKNGSLDI